MKDHTRREIPVASATTAAAMMAISGRALAADLAIRMIAGVLAGSALTGATLAAERAGDDIDKNIAVLKNSKTADTEALMAAVEALGRQGPGAAKAAPLLLDVLQRGKSINEAATKALLEMGPAAIEPIVETVQDCGADEMTMKLGVRGEKAIGSFRVL